MFKKEEKTCNLWETDKVKEVKQSKHYLWYAGHITFTRTKKNKKSITHTPTYTRCNVVVVNSFSWKLKSTKREQDEKH